MPAHRILTGCLMLVLSAAAVGTEEMPLARYFGFGPIDIIKVDEGIHSLNVCDFNGDGLNDLAVVNNRQNRIELYLRRSEPKSPGTPSTDPAVINKLPSSTHFNESPILMTKRPANLVSGDFNSDGKPDLAFYGDPAGLYILRQKSTNDNSLQWQAIHTIRIDNGLPRPNCLAAGDLNGDGRTDLALACKDGVRLLLQNEQGEFDEPHLLAMESKIQEIHIGLFNEDPHTDLLIITADPQRPVALRFGTGTGAFSALIRYECDPLFATGAFDLYGGAEEEILYIEKRTGRLTAGQLGNEADAGAESGPFGSFAAVWPFASQADAAGRDMTCGDFNGDGLPDIAVSQPGAAKVSLYLQDPQRGIAEESEYPAFSKIDSLCAADVNGNGRDDLIMISVGERAIGVSRFENGRLTFPTLLELDGEPLAMETADLDQNGSPECVYISRDSEDKIRMHIYRWTPAPGDPAYAAVDLDEVVSNPEAIRVLDVNGDKRQDVILFRQYDDPILIVQSADHTFEVLNDGGKQAGLIRGVGRQSLIASDLDGDGLEDVLVVQQNFARCLRLEEDTWQIVDQFNAGGRDDQIIAAQAADLDGDGQAEILLLDARKNRLQILRADEAQTYRVIQQIDTETWNPGRNLQIHWDSFGGHNQLLLFDGTQFALLDLTPAQETVLPESLEPLFTHETSIEDGRYSNFTCGDLNADGRPDLACVDYKKNHIEILTLPPNADTPVTATCFRVFEEKNYSESNTRSLAEPRELLTADLTGDGLDDLVTIIHDRIIIYPQDG